MIQIIILLKAITEFFLYLFIGRALVFFLCFGKHNNNLIYKLFLFLTTPIEGILKKFILTKNNNNSSTVFTIMLLLSLWILLLILKVIIGGPESFDIK